MTELNDISYKLRNGNAGRGALNTDGVSGFVLNGVAIAGNIVLGTTYKVYSLKDVEALGITSAWDITNKLLVWETFNRHFVGYNRRCETHFMIVAQTVTLTQMWDKENSYAAKLLNDAEGAIRVIGCVRNPATGYTPTLLNGMDADSYNAVFKAQELIEANFALQRLTPCAVLEVRSLTSTAGSAANMRDLSTACRNVTPVILQDPAIGARASNPFAASSADVGTVVGLISKAVVSQNIGEHSDDFQLQNQAQGFYITCGLSSGQLTKNADLDTLMTSGYCFGHAVVDFDGFWLNDFPTATSLTEDDFAYGSINRVAFKCLQVVRKKLMYYVRNKGMQTDPKTFKFTEEYRGYLEDIAKEEITKQLGANIVKDSADAYIDPETNLRTTNGAFEVEIGFSEIIQGKKITLSIGLNPKK